MVKILLRPVASGMLLLVLLLAGCKDDLAGAGGGSNSLPAPGTLTATPTGPVVLTWTASSGHTGYRVEVNAGAFGTPPYSAVIQLPAAATSTVYYGDPNTTYSFRVYAVTAASQSDPSNVVTATVPNVPPRCPLFTGLARDWNSVDLQWVSGGGATSFLIERFNSSIGDYVPVTTLGGGSTGFLDTVTSMSVELPLHRITPSNGSGSGPRSTARGMTYFQSYTGLTAIVTPPGPGPYDYGISESMAADPAGDLHFAYHDYNLSSTWYAKYSSLVGSASQQADPGIQNPSGNGFDGTSIALDANGKVHIASSQYYLDYLRYATNASGSWVTTTVSTSGGKHPKLKISPIDGSLHMVYLSGITLMYATKAAAAGSWSISNIPINSDPSSIHGLDLDSGGNIHVILADNTNALWHYSPVLPTGFEFMTSGSGYGHISLTIGAGNVLHVAYNNTTSGALLYATKSTGSWSFRIAHYHVGGNLGRHNSIAADGSGNVYITYYDAKFGRPWQARLYAGSSEFVQMQQYTTGNMGQYTSTLIVGSQVVSAWYDASQGRPYVFWYPR